ncbi:MAG: alpha/beta fold hydrolase [Candidatus Omnitrophica bacterium]|nr:alpha/beta fold hydrolase [Candidatus Omnitrophota bacterium]
MRRIRLLRNYPRLRKSLQYLFLFVLLVFSTGCAYNLYATHKMEKEIKKYPRDPQTGVVKGTEAITLEGDGPNAALLVHGFVGSRIDFNDLGEVLNEQGLTVRLTRLPGHGTFAVQHAVTTADQLIEAVRTEYLAMKQDYDQVALVGFSMGGALSSIVASEEQVDRLVLIAPYFGVTYRWYYIIPAEVTNALFGWWIPYVVKGERFTCVNRKEAKKELFCYKVLSTQGADELIRIGEMARDPELLSRIQCPVLMLQSRNDRAASPDRSEEAFDLIGSRDKQVIWYEESNHHILWDYDREDAKRRIVEFLEPLFPRTQI